MAIGFPAFHTALEGVCVQRVLRPGRGGFLKPEQVAEI